MDAADVVGVKAVPPNEDTGSIASAKKSTISFFIIVSLYTELVSYVRIDKLHDVLSGCSGKEYFGDTLGL